MLKHLLDFYNKQYTPRWVVLLGDSLIVYFSFLFSYLLRMNFETNAFNSDFVLVQAAAVSAVYIFFFVLWKSFRGVVRHTNQYDAIKLLWVSLSSIAVLIAVTTVVRFIDIRGMDLLTFPVSVLVIHSLLSFVGLLAVRLVTREAYERLISSQQTGRFNTLIYGAGAAGVITKHTLDRETTSLHKPIGFIDDDIAKTGKTIEGIPVFHPSTAFQRSFILRNRVREVIISIQNLSPQKRQVIVDRCLAFNLRVKQIPSVQGWINGELSYKQIKDVKIEDLLERDPIKLDSQGVRHYVEGKTILVTGAAGSIGSEIARQLLHYKPKKVVLLDQAETPMYEIDQEIRANTPQFDSLYTCVIANVKDLFRMEYVFNTYKPDIIFHAAAYKHVPLMEDNPYESIKVNVFGTKIVADLAVEHKVKKFVMVSTDKAVNPTNVMGATKRVAEIYTQSLNTSQNATQFITTRFGNVLGSNGSVIPLFKKQIEKGGPITLTDKNIVRYFMTIPEACNLVLEAGAMGNGGEIFIFDMGKAVKIYDLACKMIKLSGLELDKDISIKLIGLRPGEKLYEELLSNKENTLPTHHNKIMKAKVEANDFDMVKLNLELLSDHIMKQDEFKLVRVLKALVPEYISNNSKFASLDKANIDSI